MLFMKKSIISKRYDFISNPFISCNMRCIPLYNFPIRKKFFPRFNTLFYYSRFLLPTNPNIMYYFCTKVAKVSIFWTLWRVGRRCLPLPT